MFAHGSSGRPLLRPGPGLIFQKAHSRRDLLDQQHARFRCARVATTFTITCLWSLELPPPPASSPSSSRSSGPEQSLAGASSLLPLRDQRLASPRSTYSASRQQSLGPARSTDPRFQSLPDARGPESARASVDLVTAILSFGSLTVPPGAGHRLAPPRGRHCSIGCGSSHEHAPAEAARCCWRSGSPHPRARLLRQPLQTPREQAPRRRAPPPAVSLMILLGFS